MGIVNAIFGDGSERMLSTLRSVAHAKQMRELDFRDGVYQILASKLPGISLLREAGVGKTRVDLHAHYEKHDYLITIKKGLNAQKLKTVRGEISTLLDSWRATVPGNKTYVVFYPFALTPEQLADYHTEFLTFARKNSNRAFEIVMEFPQGSSDAR